MKKSFAIVFDFDGVIVDSLEECYLVAVKTYNSLGGNIKLSKKSKLLYKKYRPYLRITEDHIPALKMIERGVFRKDFMKKFRKRFKEEVEFVKRFYEIRKELQKENIRKWIRYHKPFPNVIDIIKRNERDWNIFISSTKDKESIFKILRALGIKIPIRKIFSREFSNNKVDHIKAISKIEKISEDKILFIDDVLENLEMVKKKTKAKVALASWGYTTKEHIKFAKKSGIEILSLNNLEEKLSELIRFISPIYHKTVALIIENNGKFLLIKRANRPEKNYWGFPGGHLEKGETPFEAIKREAKEEVGEVKIYKKHLFSFIHDVDIGHKHHCFVFKGKLIGNLRKNKEVKDFKFFSLDEMKNINLTNYTLQILNRILYDE